MADHQYEREIDELLRHMEGDSRAPLPFRRLLLASCAAARPRAHATTGGQAAVERLMAAAVILLVGTFVLTPLAPGVVGFTCLMALSAFVAALGLSVWNGASGHPTRYTRGAYGPHAAGAAIDWNQLAWRFRRWVRRLRG
jgi:hypothetical protein